MVDASDMSVCTDLGEWLQSVEVPREEALIRTVAQAVADCFGCILAGAGSEVLERVLDTFAPLGQGNVPVFGTRVVLPAPSAALACAVAGHSWELDDWEEPGNTHPSVVLVPALLTASCIHRISGERFREAYVIGTEIIMRLGELVSLDHYARGYHSTATLGAIGTAGAVARAMGLSTGQSAHALALATSQAVGYTIQFGSNAKPLQAGFAARAGIESALLAAKGATGQPQVMDSLRGFAGLMGQVSQQRLIRFRDRLGTPFALQEFGVLMKPWPSCGYTHRLMTAAMEVRPRLGGELDQVIAVRAAMPDFHRMILPFDCPGSRNEALFSVPACIAQVLVAGDLTIEDSASRFWERQEVARLIGLTEVTVKPARNPDLNFDPGQPDCLRIECADGVAIEAVCAYPLGAPQNPMTSEQLARKFQSITGRSKMEFRQLQGWIDANDIAAFFREAAK